LSIVPPVLPNPAPDELPKSPPPWVCAPPNAPVPEDPKPEGRTY